MSTMFLFIIYIIAIICLVGQASAFSATKSGIVISPRQSSQLFLQKSRRSFGQAIVATTSFIIATTPAFADDVLLMDKSSPEIPPFKGGSEEAKDRLRGAIKDIDSLLANYDKVSGGGGGDNVRLYLGTQGTKSHMYGLPKALKSLKEEVDDIVEYTETLNDFEAYKYQAEGAAYQSMFVEHSSAKGTPESFLKTAKGDIVNMRKYMGELANLLGI